MARAMTETTKGSMQTLEPPASTHEARCTRCGWLMVSAFFTEIPRTTAADEISAKRCVQCGEVLDPVIQRNREIQQGSIMVRSPTSYSDAL